jgi:hypothetical protein
MKLRNAWVMVLALCSAGAYAADDTGNWSFGLGASSFDFERKGAGGHSYNTHGYIARVGYDLGSYLGIEGRIGVGDKSTTDGAGLRMEAQRAAGIYARANLPLERLKLYVIGGYATVSVKGELVGTATNTKELKGTSYGVGIELYGNRTTALTAEYMRYVSEQTYTDAPLGLDNKFDVNAVSFGFIHHF